jgi:hypothetical protein
MVSGWFHEGLRCSRAPAIVKELLNGLSIVPEATHLMAVPKPSRSWPRLFAELDTLTSEGYNMGEFLIVEWLHERIAMMVHRVPTSFPEHVCGTLSALQFHRPIATLSGAFGATGRMAERNGQRQSSRTPRTSSRCRQTSDPAANSFGRGNPLDNGLNVRSFPR